MDQRTMRAPTHVLSLIVLWLVTFYIGSVSGSDKLTTKSPNNVHALVVSSSRYWFNYRHAVNALAIYRVLKENGIPDENIRFDDFGG